MNVRFTEELNRADALKLTSTEQKILEQNRLDGRSTKKMTLKCEQDIYNWGVF